MSNGQMDTDGWAGHKALHKARKRRFYAAARSLCEAILEGADIGTLVFREKYLISCYQALKEVE